jgi:hypothetical protein
VLGNRLNQGEKVNVKTLVSLGFAAALSLTAAASLALTAPPAGAVAHQLCDNSSPHKCLNAWNGGPLVKTYAPDVNNDNFDWQPVKGRCQAGSALTTANCPLPGTPAGELIVQIQYFNNPTACIGDNANNSGDAKAAEVAGFCNNTNTGTGGAWGSLFIIDTQTTCAPGYQPFLNVHWSNSWNDARWLGYPGSPVNGTQWFLNTASDNNACMHQGA